MRLDKLNISEFKNLRNFEIDFDETELTTVLIGQNGTGKSNLIEAIVVIFRDLDLGNDPQFRYELEYTCRGHQIQVNADPERPKDKMKISVDGETISLAHLSRDSERTYLPNNVFGYYSGPSNRLERHFDLHQERFYRDLLDGKEKPLRPLFYARLIHSQFVLLAFYSFQQPNLDKFLKDYFDISELKSVLFILKEPPWWQKAKHRDELFWGARGVVRDFLEALFEISLAPIKQPERVHTSFRRSSKSEERFYLYVRDLETLNRLAKQYLNSVGFFKTLESTYISELIQEVRIRVKKPNVPEGLTFTELSEGEQQLLMVLGLLRFTNEDESLFLLDEPDTHLNPAWKLEYLDLIERVVGKYTSSQIILATHDPIVIGGMKKEQVRILTKKDDGQIHAEPPEEDPAGMGVAALLTSDVFGLRTSLDLGTQRKLDEKQSLLVKQRTEALKPEELQRLEALNQELSGLGFTYSMRDPLYTRFLEALQKHAEFEKPVLTREEREKQAKLARQIMQELQAEEAD